MGKKKNEIDIAECMKETVFSTYDLSDTDLNACIDVMIKIDPRMRFCIKGVELVSIDGIEIPSEIECMSSLILHEDDNTRMIYLLLKKSGMIKLSEKVFNSALNAKGMSKSLKAFLKLYFHIEKDAKKSKNKKEEK